ncbi:MAG: hypothetical protein KF850_32420 [Labilithrix sp.]|nr:hypothetical protein [Labilithrix sp.]
MPLRGYQRLSSVGLVAAVFAATWAGVFACSTTETSYIEEDEPDTFDAGFDTQPSAESGLGVLTFMPERSYSGYDGTHRFIVPVAVYDSADDLDVTVDDPAAAEIVAKKLTNPVRTDGTTDNGKYFFVTVKKPGTITLTATSQGKSATSTITVASYEPSRWAAGETRYENGGSGDPPCTDCHVNGSAIDHSPAALATADDEKIAVVITTGISTSGFPIKIDNQAGGHQWTVTDAERDGLVTYLRSLEPKGFK